MITRNQAGEFTFTANDRTEVVDSLKELFMTPVGLEYKRDYFVPENGDDDLEKILKAAQLVAGGPNITVRNMAHALRLILDAGEILPQNFSAFPRLEEIEPDTRPRGRDGKPLTDSQARWSEMTDWTNTHSMTEVNARRRTDPQYAAFVAKAYAAEVTHEIDGAVVPAGEPTKSVKQTDALRRFVELYNRTPVSAMKPINGVVTLDGDTVPYAEFQRLLTRATNAGLI